MTSTPRRSLSVVTPPASQQPRKQLTPSDPPMVPFAVTGIAIWLVLGLIFLAMRPTLADGENERWIAIAFAGVLLGLPGLGLMIIHDRNRARRRATRRD